MLKSIAPSLFVLASCAATSNTDVNCPNPNLPCAANTTLATLPDTDLSLNATLEQSAATFTSLFGKVVPPTIVVSGGDVSGEKLSALKENGFVDIMPWLDDESRNQLQKSVVLKQVEDQIKDLPEAMQEIVRQQALEQIKSSSKPADRNTELGALSHELGHLWFISNYNNGEENKTAHGYGGWAPDWLDETAAILMENTGLKKNRRDAFAAMESSQRFALAEFLEMEHPSAKAARSLYTPDQDSNGSDEVIIRTLSGDEAEAFLKASGGDRAVNFYSQVLVFSDYLTNRANGTTVFPNIAVELASGKAMADWLAGNTFGLPKTISDLESDWSQWLSDNGYG